MWETSLGERKKKQRNKVTIPPPSLSTHLWVGLIFMKNWLSFIGWLVVGVECNCRHFNNKLPFRFWALDQLSSPTFAHQICARRGHSMSKATLDSYVEETTIENIFPFTPYSSSLHDDCWEVLKSLLPSGAHGWVLPLSGTEEAGQPFEISQQSARIKWAS